MVSLTCSTAREAGVTLVTGRVTNPDRPRRVRLAHRGDGPVWPPRSHGVPAAGWDEDGFECVLAADETRAVGYATPASTDGDPLVVAETEPADPDDGGFEPRTPVPDVDDSPAGVVRALGAPAPPRDAVPEPDAGARSDPDPGRDPHRDTGEPTGADAAMAWLAAVEERVDAAERLAPTTPLPAATDALATLGEAVDEGEGRDVDGAGTAATLRADAERLRRVADRAAGLAERAERAELPEEAVDRLA